MSYSVSGTTITLTRGDTFKAQINITDRGGNTYTPVEGDKVRFAMKAKYSDPEPLVVVNNGAFSSDISVKDQKVTIPLGYHDGSGKVGIDEIEQAKIIPGNIMMGVEILGVVGELEPSSAVTAQSKTVTPTTTEQIIIPDEGTDYLSQVTVKAIPYTESTNAAGGTTVTIAG